MIGTITRTDNGIQKRLSLAMQAFDYMKALGRAGRNELGYFMRSQTHYRHNRPHRARTIRVLQRCLSLATMFPVVERDESCKRQANASIRRNGYDYPEKIEIPLIFHSSLPAKTHTKIEFKSGDKSFAATAITPMPTPEALQQIRHHGKKFDWLEVWWVPNDVLVQQVPEPDPIVVGAVRLPDNSIYYFELHRWVDESVEASWWTREGY